MDKFDKIILGILTPVTGRTVEELEALLELPPDAKQGDRALPCFRFAKEEKVSPNLLAVRWKEALNEKPLPVEIERVEEAGGYLNFFLQKALLTTMVLEEIKSHPGAFGFVKKKKAPSVVLEFSSPNIAKPFSIGHLRSTNIGASLARILRARGWNVIAINHLGDWGTQFGRLMAAYRRWGNAELLRSDPIMSLYKLYVRFHEEEVSDPTLVEEGREWFARLERGDSEAKELWEWFRELSLMEFKRLYQRLNIEFDHYWGESFYTSKMSTILELLENKKISKVSDLATIVDLEPYGLSTCVVKKSDDSSLYLTRDLAAAVYRREQIAFEQMIYVVGNPQKLHFAQLFKILELMGYGWAKKCEHVSFGHIAFGDEAMSTRKGNIVFLADVLSRATVLARKIVEEKNPDLENKEEVAEQVGLGAILFADLSSRRMKDVKFDWDSILTFDGETGPYLQYTLVRTRSLIRRYEPKANESIDVTKLSSDEEIALVRQLSLFPSMLGKAEREREPFVIAQYAIQLSKAFNRFYSAQRVLDASDELTAARMILVRAVSDLLATSLHLLGVPTPEKM